METKFTPGPWHIGGIMLPDTPTPYANVWSDAERGNACGKVIAQCLPVANAKLIATAPEMLEVLMTIENDNNQVPEWLWIRIKQVIQKATE